MGKIAPLFTTQGYFQEFYNIFMDFRSHKECYEYLEAKLESDFGVTMYECYSTFKKGKANYLAGKKLKKRVKII
jgi:hypothetical protein